MFTLIFASDDDDVTYTTVLPWYGARPNIGEYLRTDHENDPWKYEVTWIVTKIVHAENSTDGDIEIHCKLVDLWTACYNGTLFLMADEETPAAIAYLDSLETEEARDAFKETFANNWDFVMGAQETIGESS